MKLISKLISRIKGEEFILDERIPLTYMLDIMWSRAMMLVCGTIKLRRFGRAFVHRTSHIKCPSKITTKGNLSVDRACYIDALSTDGITFGNNVSIGKCTTIECTGTLKLLGKGLVVGDNAGLGTNGHFGCAGGITIGDSTIFGNYVSLHSENHNFADLDVPIRLQGVNRKGIRIGRNCWIGAKVTILDGVEIGDGCIVAAGAVVAKGKFPANSIIGGVPAKVIKSR